MRFLCVAVLWAAGCALAGPAGAAGPIYKCLADGKVTYQSEPCPVPRAERPTVEQLNRERLRQARDAGAAGAAASRAPAGAAVGRADATGAGEPSRPVVRPTETREPLAPAAAAFRCDGRRYCSQMTSCAEAKFFLARCPGVRMDGDRDGVPCEEQWCSR